MTKGQYVGDEETRTLAASFAVDFMCVWARLILTDLAVGMCFGRVAMADINTSSLWVCWWASVTLQWKTKPDKPLAREVHYKIQWVSTIAWGWNLSSLKCKKKNEWKSSWLWTCFVPYCQMMENQWNWTAKAVLDWKIFACYYESAWVSNWMGNFLGNFDKKQPKQLSGLKPLTKCESALDCGNILSPTTERLKHWNSQ